jgi:hypothetical protein
MLNWVHWHTKQRLQCHSGDLPPAEFDNTYFAVQTARELNCQIRITRAFIAPTEL